MCGESVCDIKGGCYFNVRLLEFSSVQSVMFSSVAQLILPELGSGVQDAFQDTILATARSKGGDVKIEFSSVPVPVPVQSFSSVAPKMALKADSRAPKKRTIFVTISTISTIFFLSPC